MTFQELTTIAPFVAAILTAIAIMLVDLAWPNRSAARGRDRAHRPGDHRRAGHPRRGSGTQLAFGT